MGNINSVLDEFEWTPDCQGKQDFDGDIIQLSTRYWPRGGGFHRLDTRDGSWEGNEDRPDVLPAAHSSIIVLGKPWREKDFEAETETEVKTLVEAWAKEQIVEILTTLGAVDE